jgi:hypothetical protein
LPTWLKYDPSTTLGFVRFLVGDTNFTNNGTGAIFMDEEINACLQQTQTNNPFAAASMCYTAIISNFGRMAVFVKREGYESRYQAIKDLTEIRDSLAEQALTVAGLQWTDALLTDELYESFRPEWRDNNTIMVE